MILDSLMILLLPLRGELVLADQDLRPMQLVGAKRLRMVQIGVDAERVIQWSIDGVVPP